MHDMNAQGANWAPPSTSPFFRRRAGSGGIFKWKRTAGGVSPRLPPATLLAAGRQRLRTLTGGNGLPLCDAWAPAAPSAPRAFAARVPKGPLGGGQWRSLLRILLVVQPAAAGHRQPLTQTGCRTRRTRMKRSRRTDQAPCGRPLPPHAQPFAPRRPAAAAAGHRQPRRRLAAGQGERGTGRRLRRRRFLAACGQRRHL